MAKEGVEEGNDRRYARPSYWVRRSAGVAMGRTKNLADEDLEELKGNLDLSFGFSYEEIPELCSTLLALELCYSISERFLDKQQQQRSIDVDHTVRGEAPLGLASSNS